MASPALRADPRDAADAESPIEALKLGAVHPTERAAFEDVAADPPRFIDEACGTTRPRSAPGRVGPVRLAGIDRPAPARSAA